MDVKICAQGYGEPICIRYQYRCPCSCENLTMIHSKVTKLDRNALFTRTKLAHWRRNQKVDNVYRSSTINKTSMMRRIIRPCMILGKRTRITQAHPQSGIIVTKKLAQVFRRPRFDACILLNFCNLHLREPMPPAPDEGQDMRPYRAHNAPKQSK